MSIITFSDKRRVRVHICVGGWTDCYNMVIYAVYKLLYYAVIIIVMIMLLVFRVKCTYVHIVCFFFYLTYTYGIVIIGPLK